MYYNVDKGSKKTELSNVRFGIFTVLVMASIVLFGSLTPTFAKGGGGAALPGDNKQIVTGTTPACATTTVEAISDLTISQRYNQDGILLNYLSPLTVKGTLENCSTSLQAYYVEFTESLTAGADDILGQRSCILPYFGQWSVGDFIMKSGSKTGWGFSNDPSLAGIPDVTTCLGKHTINVTVFDRNYSNVMYQTTVTYNVVQK